MMPSATVIGGDKPYLMIRVECSLDRAFEQTIYCEKDGEELAMFLQQYADDYEAGLPTVEPG